MSDSPALCVGDKVCHSIAYRLAMKAIDARHGREVGARVFSPGIIIGFSPHFPSIAYVEWDDNRGIAKAISVSNLVRPESLSRMIWTEGRRNVWSYGGATIRQVRVLRGATAWRVTFPDSKTFHASTIEEAKTYAEERLARLAADEATS